MAANMLSANPKKHGKVMVSIRGHLTVERNSEVKVAANGQDYT